MLSNNLVKQYKALHLKCRLKTEERSGPVVLSLISTEFKVGEHSFRDLSLIYLFLQKLDPLVAKNGSKQRSTNELRFF